MQNLKEPALGTKLRNDVTQQMSNISISDRSMSQAASNKLNNTAAKAQRPSAMKTMASSQPDDGVGIENDANAANRRRSSTEQITVATERLSLTAATKDKPMDVCADAMATASPMDESLIVLPNKEAEIVSLIDEDEAASVATSVSSQSAQPELNLMPPPAKPAPAARKARTKKKAPTAASNVVTKIKSEKLSMTGSASGSSVAADAVPVVAAPSVRSTRSKQSKAPIPMPMVDMKAAIKSEKPDDAQAAVVAVSPDALEIVPSAAVPSVGANTTLESVYEDARADVAMPPNNVAATSSSTSTTADQDDVPMAEEPTVPPVMDATYVQPNDVANDTYVHSQPPQMQQQPDATFDAGPVDQANAAASNDLCDATYAIGTESASNESPRTPSSVVTVGVAADVEAKKQAPVPKPQSRVRPSMESIMTEDNSDEEDALPLQALRSKVQMAKKKNPNEIFK